MRTPKKHVAKNGEESWKVRFRSATGAQKSETFYDPDEAVEFCKLLDAVGPARALKYLDDLEAEGGGPRGAVVTLDDVFARWLAWKGAKKKDGTLLRVRSQRSVDDYERMWKARISPKFGHKPANLISQSDVQTWVDDDLAAELEPKTIADYHALLHSVYGWAIHPSRAFVVADPCLETELPKRRKKKPKGLRPDEWVILHKAALSVDQDCADLLLFLVATGWRWSEAVAVQTLAVEHWVDEHDVSHTYVTMGRVLRRGGTEGSRYVFVEDAKSDAGQRRVRLMGAGEEMVLRRVYGKGPTDLLLTTPRGGRWGYSYFYDRWWARPTTGRKDYAPRRTRITEAAAKMGLDRPGLTLHWLRHTHVGMLILAGEPLTAIQRRLGHASIKTTSDTYGKMIEDASPEGLARAAAMLGGASQTSELESA